MTVRYLSLFSGVEAASVAWKPLGWRAVAFSEIEPFPCAVLAHHYPHVPNLGDVTKITDEQIEALGRIDLIVGGFPCQDLSVAGKRAGLRNEDGSTTRSGLFFDAMRIVRVARERCGLRWLLIENVPGLYSNNAGRDFAAVVGEMVGAEFDVPRDGWRNAGFAVGPHGLCEWATLDAQFFGVAQRRRRVFALADFGDWASRPPILLEPESLRGDSPTRREAGQGVAGCLAARTFVGGAGGRPEGAAAGHFIAAPHADLSPALKARDSKGPSSDGDGDGDGAILVPMVAPTLQAGGNSTGGDRPPGTTVDTCDSLIPVAFTQNQRDEVRELDIAGALAAEPGMKQQTYVAFSCKDHGADAGIAPTLRSMGHDGSHANGGGQVAVAFAHQAGGTQTTLGYDPEIGTAPTLAKCQTPAVHAGMQVRRLTPVECARLQGFPDSYLDIIYRGKPAADGPKYRALGNSFAVPVVHWIGQRIAAVDALRAA